MKKGITKCLAAFVATAMMVSGCAGSSSGSSSSKTSRPDPDMSLNVAVSETILASGQLAKPWMQATFATSRLYRNLFQAEVGELEVKPDLVDTFDVSEDGLVYEFTLKDDLRWSDGETITVEDVIFSIETFLVLAETQTVNTLLITALSDIVGVDDFIANPDGGLSGLAIDGDTISISLNSRNNLFLQALAQFVIFPEHALSDLEPEELFATDIEYWDDPVVSGMYKLGEHVVDESITLVYNDQYTAATPYIESIVMRADFTDEELSYFETNDVSKILDYRAMPNKNEYDVNTTFYRYFIFNIDKDGEIDTVLEDDSVRRAFMYAIDREQLVRDVYYGIATVNNSPIVQEYNQSIDFDYYYDPEKAVALLEEAEYDFDRPVTLLYYYSDEISIKFMEECARYLEEIGLTVELIAGNLLTNNDYDIALKGLSVFTIDDWYNEYLSSSQIVQEVFGGEPVFDDLIVALRQAPTQDERNEILVQLQELEYDVFYKYPLFIMGHKVYISSDITVPSNLLFGNSNYRYDLDFEEWKITTSN